MDPKSKLLSKIAGFAPPPPSGKGAADEQQTNPQSDGGVPAPVEETAGEDAPGIAVEIPADSTSIFGEEKESNADSDAESGADQENDQAPKKPVEKPPPKEKKSVPGQNKLLSKIGGFAPPPKPPAAIGEEEPPQSMAPKKPPPPRPQRSKQHLLGRATSVSSGLDVGRPKKNMNKSPETYRRAKGKQQAASSPSISWTPEVVRDRPVSMSLGRDNRVAAMLKENEDTFIRNFLAAVKKYAGSNKQLTVVSKYCSTNTPLSSSKRGSKRKKKKAKENNLLTSQLEGGRQALLEVNGQLDNILILSSRTPDKAALSKVILTLGIVANGSSFLVQCMKPVVLDNPNMNLFKQVLTASRTVRDSLTNLLEILAIAPVEYKNPSVEKQISQAIQTIKQAVSHLTMKQASLIGGNLIPDWRRHEILGAAEASMAAATKLCWMRDSFTPSQGEQLVEAAKVVGTTVSQLNASIIDSTNSDIMVALPKHQQYFLGFVDLLKSKLQGLINETKTFLGSEKEDAELETPAFLELKDAIIDTLAATNLMASLSITKIISAGNEGQVPSPSEEKREKAAKIVEKGLPERPPQPPDNEKKRNRKQVSSDASKNVWDDIVDTEDNILYNEDGTLKAGTINKLIEKVTSPDSPDSVRMMKTFIATYASFTTPSQLILKLKERFEVPAAYSSHELPVRLRVCNVLRTWVETNFRDFTEEDVEGLLNFVDNSLCSDPKLSKYGKTLQAFITKQRKTEVETVKKQLVELKLEPKIPLSPARFLTVFDEAEVARQMTLVEHNIYRAIQPMELLNQAWSKEGLKHKAPNVRRMIKRSTALSFWVASCILWQPSLRERARVFTRIVNIGEHLRRLNNYNSIMALISGVNLTAVHRLEHTRSELSSSTIKKFQELEAIMSSDSSFHTYRISLRNADPPCVPFIGVYLTDLTFSDDGSPDKIGGLINFGKRSRIFNMIEEILRFQTVKYDFEYVDHIASFLNELPQNSDKDLYDLSRIVEPKGSDKKSIL